MALKKTELKPGMSVKNELTGAIGVVRGDPGKPSKLRKSASFCVAVRLKGGTGHWDYPYWRTANLVFAD